MEVCRDGARDGGFDDGLDDGLDCLPVPLAAGFPPSELLSDSSRDESCSLGVDLPVLPANMRDMRFAIVCLGGFTE